MPVPLIIAGVLIVAGVLWSRKKSAPQQTETLEVLPVNSDEVSTVSETVESAVEEVVGGVAGAIDAVVETPLALVAGAKYADIIERAAAEYDVPVLTLYRLLYAESRFRDDIITGKVRSRVGALGIAQFMPDTAVEELGSVEAALDPYKAIPGAARYLAKLIRSTGSEVAGVAAYNWGIGNVKRKGLAKAPQETVTYVKDVTGESIT